MDKVNAKIGTDYKLFNYYGAEMQSMLSLLWVLFVTQPKRQSITLTAAGEKVGVVKVHLYRPFCAQALFRELFLRQLRQISVLDRTKEPGALGEPLYLDVVAALKGSGKFRAVPVYTGRYGLGSKDTTPAQIVAVNRKRQTKRRFTIGIIDDVTNLSLELVHHLLQLQKEHTTVSSGVLELTVL